MAADFKMSDQMEPESTATAEEQAQEAARSSRVRTVSEVSITEELEKRLLAEEDEDLDVIECFVDDFDSEEDDCRRKEADKVEQEKNTVEVLEVVRIVHSAEEDEPEDSLEGFEDVLQIDEGDVEVVAPKASVHVRGDERMLDKPLVKQIVMEVAGGATDCGDDYSMECNGGEKSPERDVSRAPTPVGTQEDSDAEQPLVIADSVEANVGGTQEDPDVLQLKLDLYQSMGDMDYEPDDDEHRDPAKDNRTDDCGEEKMERRFKVKEEPMSPVEDRLAKIQLALEDIPTIELSSDDDFVAVVQQPKKTKKKSKKKAKKRNKSECSLDEAVIVQDPLPAVMSSTSSKTILSCDSMYMDEELLKTGFRMELRKRKSATLLEETGTTPLTRQRRNPRKSVDSSTSTSVSQSKSKASVVSNASSSGLGEDKPAKRPKEKKSAFQPVSTEDTLKINSLFADCEKGTVQPDIELASILDDDKPLLDMGGSYREADPFEERSHKKLQPRQTKIIDALPRVGPLSSKSKWNEHAAVATSPLTQKPKVVPEIIESLEADLAMSSSDEDVPLEKFCASGGKGASSEKAMKPGRKRGRPQLKQHIEDYFGPTSEDQAECDQPPATEPPTVANGGSKKPSSKRRKKRLRINSNSSDGDDDATTMESVSLAGTSSSTTATVRSNEVDPELAQVEQPRTDEMRVVLSPLTDEKIEKLRSKCNTPKKGRALSKASQTEVQGLSWKIQLNQIDFFSEYFVNLYDLITNGRRWKNFEGVVIAGRGVVSPEVAPQCPQPANGHARSDVQQLLFRRAIDEVDLVSPMRIDPVARERSERNMRTNFRIPKLGKQPSRSPQDVTSSTQHDVDCKEEKPKPPTVVGGGYSNDQLVVAPRRNVAAENGNHLFAIRPEDEPRNDASRAMSFRRTIRNDNVQQQPLMVPAAQQPPVDSGFPLYGVPEQAPPPPQYRSTCSGSNTFGGYLASNQEVVDVKPNFSALAGQAALMGAPGMMNSSRYLDLLTMLLLREQLSMQEQQQQNRFPPMINNAQYGGAGPVMLAAMMAHNQQPLPPEPAPTVASTGRRFAREPLPEVAGPPIQPNENSEHISQLLGCYDHLMGRCIKNPCQFSHTLPTEASLFQNLMNSAQDVVMATYGFIKVRDNLFQRYFVVYAEVMGRRNLRHQLVDTVPDCEKSKRTFSYYRYVVDGLTVNGTLSRARAVQFVLEKHTKVNFDQINVLVSLIIDTADEIPQFLQWLEEFSRVQNYQFEVASINRLVEFCVRASKNVLHSTVVDVAKLTYRLLLGVATGKEPRVNPGHLLEFVQLLIKSNVGLDVEEIVSKYRANEMSDRR